MSHKIVDSKGIVHISSLVEKTKAHEEYYNAFTLCESPDGDTHNGRILIPMEEMRDWVEGDPKNVTCLGCLGSRAAS